ncbi:hypothetical protein GCM10007421_17780 [Halopseudomonas oceani]|nr:hypothetical protein GCM10007421_17780 [Halopseudomonas oceani]
MQYPRLSVDAANIEYLLDCLLWRNTATSNPALAIAENKCLAVNARYGMRVSLNPIVALQIRPLSRLHTGLVQGGG